MEEPSWNDETDSALHAWQRIVRCGVTKVSVPMNCPDRSVAVFLAFNREVESSEGVECPIEKPLYDA